MRFDDMLLNSSALGSLWRDGRASLSRAVAVAQHEANMAYEVECPWCEGTGERFVGGYADASVGCEYCGGDGVQTSANGSDHYSGTKGTGRVTLGAIVQADRARKVAQ